MDHGPRGVLLLAGRARTYCTTDGLRVQMVYYRAFSQTIAENQSRAQHKLTVSVLALGGDHGVADFLGEMLAPVRSHLTAGLLLPEECPDDSERQVIPFPRN